MRNLKLTLFAILLLPVAALAQSTVKVGVVDFERAALESDDGIAASEGLQVYYDGLTEGLLATETELADAQTRLEQQQRALSATALTQLQNDITRLQTRLQRDAEDAELDMTAKQAEMLNPVYQKAQDTVLTYADEQRFTLILDASAGVIFASPAADVTNEVIRRMNDGAAAAALAPAADDPAPAADDTAPAAAPAP
jgi:outer membrane protein